MLIPRKDWQYKLGYLAGILDGEGSFSCYVTKYKSNRLYNGKRRQYGGITKNVMIHNTNKAIVETCRDIITEILGEPARFRKENRLTVTGKSVWYVWISGGNQLRKLLPVITPYLVGKRRQAELMLELLNRKKWSRVSDYEKDLALQIVMLNDKSRKPESVETNTLDSQKEKIESDTL